AIATDGVCDLECNVKEKKNVEILTDYDGQEDGNSCSSLCRKKSATCSTTTDMALNP
ncbi:unnamed protein product, partial [Brassica rapa subsp. narinosa]